MFKHILTYESTIRLIPIEKRIKDENVSIFNSVSTPFHELVACMPWDTSTSKKIVSVRLS